MQEGNAMAILREFGRHRLAVTSSSNKRWRWASEVIRFPDAICPWCGGAMRSTRIWLVDEVHSKLLGQIKLDGSKLVKEAPKHPHYYLGQVCTRIGRSDGPTSVAQALFIAMNLESMYWMNVDPRKGVKYYREGMYKNYPEYAPACKGWLDWLSDVFDHTCADVTVVSGLSAELERAAAKEMAVRD